MSDPMTAVARSPGSRATRTRASAARTHCTGPERRLEELSRSRGALRRVVASLAAALLGPAARAAGSAAASAGPAPSGLVQLGYVRTDDYARERLGLSGRALQDLARVGRALDGLPRLDAALAAGALPWSKARLLARFVGPDDEAPWIALAGRLPVRELEQRVRAADRGALAAEARGARAALPDCDEDGGTTEPHETLRLRAGAPLCFRWQHARKWSARVAGEPVPPGTALEMITAETLSALPPGTLVEPPEPPPPANVCAAQGARADGPSAIDAANVCAAQGARAEDPAPTNAANVCAAQGHGPPASPATNAANVCAAQGHGPPATPTANAANVCAAQEAGAALPPFLRPLVAGLDRASPHDLDARLRRAVRLEQRLDAELAPLLRRVTSPEHTWRGRPRTLARLAREGLGMSPRKARALVRLERVGEACPPLRAAWRDGALSWLQAQILARLLVGSDDAPGPPAWRAAWVEFARSVTLRRLEEAVDRGLALRAADPATWLAYRERPDCVAGPDDGGRAAGAGGSGTIGRQTCARDRRPDGGPLASIPLRIRAPREVARLFRAALCTVRRLAEAATGRLPGEDEAFDAMIDHALETWRVDDPRLRGRAPGGRGFAIFERDGWRCTIPGCSSRRNLHAHHIRFRSAGGSDAPENQTTLCAAHHHRCVHAGLVRVSGQAPDALWFELGVRPGQPPLARYRSGDRIA